MCQRRAGPVWAGAWNEKIITSVQDSGRKDNVRSEARPAGSASFSVSAADEAAVFLEDRRKRRDTDGWMRLSGGRGGGGR